MKELNPIIEYLQAALVDLINTGKFDNSFKDHLKEVFLLIGDKKFPAGWEALLQVFSQIFKLEIPNIVQDENIFNLVVNLNDLFYSLLKQNNKKRTPFTRNKFLQYKSHLIEIFYPFYDKTTLFYNQNSSQFNLDFLNKYLQLMKSNDKVILILIDSCFNINEFHKDEKLLYMLKLIMDRTVTIINTLNIAVKLDKEIKSSFMDNLFKILKYCGKIQSANPVIFYKDLDKYLDILFYIMFNPVNFPQDLLKVVMFNLYKVINTISYKELSEDYNQQRKYSQGLESNYNKTPEKPKRIGSSFSSTSSLCSNLVSPSKLKNFEIELKDANETFSNLFKEENVTNLIKSLLENFPFIFKKENDNLEVELLAELEEDMMPSELFSTNSMTWQMLYKNLLESLIANFQNFSLKYINSQLTSLYANYSGTNILVIDSVINFVNLLPHLYKNGTISEMDIIDYTKFISFVESLLNKSDIILKKYIVTISKWTEVLISDDSIFTYFDNLLYFIKNTKNNVIVIESMLALKNIISQFDKILKSGSQNFNIHVDKTKLENSINSRIKWGDVLSTVSAISLGLIKNIKSAELLLSMINLLTLLIGKCHYQCDGQIIEVITHSGFPDVILSTNDEFAQHAFIEMWKSLLLSFPDSTAIVNLSLQFTSITLKGGLNMNNLGLLLFLVRVVEATDEIKSILVNFVKEHIYIFKSDQKQYLSIMLFNILEEFILLDIFDASDIVEILNLCTSKYLPLFEMTKTLTMKKQSGHECEQFVCTDLAEYKSSILNTVTSLVSLFSSQKRIDVTSSCVSLLGMLLQETYLDGPVGLYSIQFLSALIPLVNRLAVMNLNLVQSSLNLILLDGLTFDSFFGTWLQRMEQMINVESRQTLLKSLDNIFHICIVTVHSEMMKKIDKDFIKEIMNTNRKRCMNIKQSFRKRIIFENDAIFKTDLHILFVESFKNSLINNDLSYDYLTQSILKNEGLIHTLNEILGLSQNN